MAPMSESNRTTIRFPPEVKAKLDKLADNAGISVQFSVVKAVRAYLEWPEVKTALKKKRGA